MTMTISIIMPCYTAAAHLPISVGSVQAQTHTDLELVIVDDGSTDDSWQTLQKLAQTDSRIRVFQQANAGAAAARNDALQKARGAYTAFVDSDDTWHPGFLEAMVSAPTIHPKSASFYSRHGMSGRRGTTSSPTRNGVEPGWWSSARN
ncbi:MAG: hypothetical protein CVU23_06560, partial [Betaproteobacteria bacterium HGW-Betaproteobacteria-17]